MANETNEKLEANGLSAESCLTLDQAGYSGEKPSRPQGLSGEEIAAALAYTAIDSATNELMDAVGMPLSAVAPPPVHRVLQCRGATPMARGRHNIDSIVLHTPEGYVSGTLGVLSGTRAGFDFYLPPSGELYKCNDYLRHFSWQAGDLRYNQRSVGIEQWDFAHRMNQAPDAHYQKLARLCAYLVETLDLSIRYASSYGGYGFIFHRVITPGARCDPDNCGKSKFDTDKLMDMVSDLVKGRSDPVKPPPVKPEGKTLYAVRTKIEIPEGTQLFLSSTRGGAENSKRILAQDYGIETVVAEKAEKKG